MNRIQKYGLTLVSGVFVAGCAVAPALSPEQRPANWAQVVGSNELRADTGLPNLHQVSPVLYRSAQPGIDGLNILNQHLAQKYGLPVEIKTVISLRNNQGDDARGIATSRKTARRRQGW